MPIEKPLGIDSRVEDLVSKGDREWFEQHPGEKFRYRDALLGEWPMEVYLARPTASSQLCVEVEQMSPGMRFRRSYWVYSNSPADEYLRVWRRDHASTV